MASSRNDSQIFEAGAKACIVKQQSMGADAHTCISPSAPHSLTAVARKALLSRARQHAGYRDTVSSGMPMSTAAKGGGWFAYIFAMFS